MRQLIARIDDDLHARLKRRAAAEGRSLNALVTEALEAAAPGGDLPADVRARATARGVLADFEPPDGAPSLADVLTLTRGWGTAVSDALSAERAES